MALRHAKAQMIERRKKRKEEGPKWTVFGGKKEKKEDKVLMKASDGTIREFSRAPKSGTAGTPTTKSFGYPYDAPDIIHPKSAPKPKTSVRTPKKAVAPDKIKDTSKSYGYPYDTSDITGAPPKAQKAQTEVKGGVPSAALAAGIAAAGAAGVALASRKGRIPKERRLTAGYKQLTAGYKQLPASAPIRLSAGPSTQKVVDVKPVKIRPTEKVSQKSKARVKRKVTPPTTETPEGAIPSERRLDRRPEGRRQKNTPIGYPDRRTETRRSIPEMAKEAREIAQRRPQTVTGIVEEVTEKQHTPKAIAEYKVKARELQKRDLEDRRVARERRQEDISVEKEQRKVDRRSGVPRRQDEIEAITEEKPKPKIKVKPPVQEAVGSSQTYEARQAAAKQAARKAVVEGHMKQKGFTKVEATPEGTLRQTRVGPSTASRISRMGAKTLIPGALVLGAAERVSAAPAGERVKTARREAKIEGAIGAGLLAASRAAPIATRFLGRYLGIPAAAAIGAYDIGRAAVEGTKAVKAGREASRQKAASEAKYGTIEAATRTRKKRKKNASS